MYQNSTASRSTANGAICLHPFQLSTRRAFQINQYFWTTDDRRVPRQSEIGFDHSPRGLTNSQGNVLVTSSSVVSLSTSDGNDTFSSLEQRRVAFLAERPYNLFSSALINTSMPRVHLNCCHITYLPIFSRRIYHFITQQWSVLRGLQLLRTGPSTIRMNHALRHTSLIVARHNALRPTSFARSSQTRVTRAPAQYHFARRRDAGATPSKVSGVGSKLASVRPPSLVHHLPACLSTSRYQNRKALVIIDHPTIATLATARSPIVGIHRGGPHTGWRERPTRPVSLPATPPAGAQNHATLIHSKRATSPPANFTTSQHPPPGQGSSRHERIPQSFPPGTLEPGPTTPSTSTTTAIRTQHTPAYAATPGVSSQSLPPTPEYRYSTTLLRHRT